MISHYFGPGGEADGYAVEQPDETASYFNSKNEYVGCVNANGFYNSRGEYTGTSLTTLYDHDANSGP